MILANCMTDAVTLHSAPFLEDIDLCDDVCRRAVKKALAEQAAAVGTSKKFANGAKIKDQDGSWSWKTYECPAPATQSNNLVADAIKMLRDHANGELLIDGIKPRRWQETVDYPSAVATVTSRMTPFGKDLLADLEATMAKLTSEGFWQQHCTLETRSLEDEALRGNYVIAYFNDGHELIGMYTGLSVDMAEWAIQHAAKLDLDVEGLEATQHHYHIGRQASSRYMLPVVVLRPDDESDLLGIGEQFFCWLLGTYRLRPDLLAARAAYGLPLLPGQGLNTTPCLEGSTDSSNLEPDQLKYRRLVFKVAQAINRLVSAVSAGDTDAIAKARGSAETSITAAGVVKGRLLVSGKYRWDAPAVPRVFGIGIPRCVAKIIALWAREAAGVRGIPATPCLEGPPRIDASLSADQRRYRWLVQRYAKAINAMVTAVVGNGSSAAAVTAAQADITRIGARVDELKGRLLTQGLFMWCAPSVVLFGIRLPGAIERAIDFGSKPTCFLRVGAADPNPEQDMFLAGPEAERAKYRGLYFNLTADGTTLHFQCVRDPMPGGWTRLADRILDWLGADSKAKRVKAAEEKAAELGARACADVAGLSELAGCGLSGDLLLKGFSTVTVPSAPQDYRFLVPKHRTAALMDALGFGAFLAARTNVPEVHKPPVRLRLIVDGTGSFNWGSRLVPPSASRWTIELLHFDGTWVALPFRLSPKNMTAKRSLIDDLVDAFKAIDARVNPAAAAASDAAQLDTRPAAAKDFRCRATPSPRGKVWQCNVVPFTGLSLRLTNEEIHALWPKDIPPTTFLSGRTNVWGLQRWQELKVEFRAEGEDDWVLRRFTATALRTAANWFLAREAKDAAAGTPWNDGGFTAVDEDDEEDETEDE